MKAALSREGLLMPQDLVGTTGKNQGRFYDPPYAVTGENAGTAPGGVMRRLNLELVNSTAK